MLSEAYREFVRRLAGHLDARRIHTDPLSTLAYGTDASCYRLNPQVVVRVRSDAEVQMVLAAARDLSLPVTFRAAGTSLSGQAVSDSILMVATDGWKDCEVLDDGARIRLQPGVVGAVANAALAPYGRKIGPDPATIGAAMIGGIVANNSSGMCCGTAQNSYRTVESLRLILADGSLLDTADEGSVDEFREHHAGLLDGLAALSARVRSDAALSARIRRKYKMKNTTGYSLNALVDFDDPLQMLLRLMIGSEGTLGFVSEVVYRTVEELPCKASALVCYPDIHAACRVVARLAGHKDVVAAAELLDRASLRSVENKAGVPADIARLPDGAAALLVETRAADASALAGQLAEVSGWLASEAVLGEVAFTDDAAESARLWAIRKGMFPSVGAMREIGTTVIIEDVVFPIDALADGTLALQALFDKHGYRDAIIFGHALEGNLHFVFTPDFAKGDSAARYEAFLNDVCHLVAVEYEGAVKAEHGTGRNMAPFVEMEWGRDAYQVMREIKALFDPQGLLNPDVILSGDPRLHMKHLKALPATDAIVDRCIECGFCEGQCPSRALTLTPRQRIVARREIARLEGDGEDPARLARLEADYVYAGEETCAACGLCATVCPVGINTGELTLKLRGEQLGEGGTRAAGSLARHYGAALGVARGALGAVSALRTVAGDKATGRLFAGARTLLGRKVAHFSPSFPRVGHFEPRTGVAGSARKVVYLPSCLTRAMAPGDAGARTVGDAVTSVLAKAGYAVIYPQDLSGLCCGTPFKSKGAAAVAADKLAALSAALFDASEGGRWPIVVDNGVCTAALLDGLADARLKVYDVTRFVHEVASEWLVFEPQDEKVALHVVCSMRRTGHAGVLNALARRCAREVVEPAGVTCCGFAGDKGFSHPELNASALATLKEEVAGCSAGFSNSATCEVGLAEHSGLSYRHLMVLVDRATRAKANGAQ
ncbi:FAD-binding and (Fe-S)-binding domain-containing protein [Crenobacter intestini]|uniref:D-lactate dehydrogenase (cytochrome) n=1 Tax=Crenobacter intestini TaxID=2563443 RepID=A0A4T0ULC2_9NEIS|nr:FAD-binding and (Fe-S)-binding domain-containing protein [Crenobacter intestini]TIC79211.1 FAD-binding oxidoreductase [Crenobacter intestini]